jgi:hypothetical protein
VRVVRRGRGSEQWHVLVHVLNDSSGSLRSRHSTISPVPDRIVLQWLFTAFSLYNFILLEKRKYIISNNYSSYYKSKCYL